MLGLSNQIETDGASLYAVPPKHSSSVSTGRVFPVLSVHKSLEALCCAQNTRDRLFELLATQSIVLRPAISESPITNAESQDPPQVYWIIICISSRFPGDGTSQSCLRNIVRLTPNPPGGWQHCGFGGSKECGCLGSHLPKGTLKPLPSEILPGITHLPPSHSFFPFFHHNPLNKLRLSINESLKN